MNALQKIVIPTHTDDRGPLSVIEIKDYVDWKPERVYYLTDVKKNRAGHAVKNEKKIYVCQKGSFTARFHDGNDWVEFNLSGPGDAVIMNEVCYRDFINFSEDAVLLAISSVNYVPEDYIFDLDEFLEFKRNQS